MPTPKKTVRKAAKVQPSRAKAAKPTTPTTKIDQVIAALKSKRGASVPDLMEITGWQAHSVRGVLAGTLKKKRGLNIVSESVAGQRLYRIASAP